MPKQVVVKPSNKKINFKSELKDISNITGLIKTTSVIPTKTPRIFQEQLLIYISGATIRLYIYSNSDNTWHYVALT